MNLKQRFQRSRFIAGEKPVNDDAITLSHRRIFILPTRRGLGLLLLIIILLLIAFVYNNNLAYLLTFLLASVFFITILHTFKSLAGLVIHAGQSNAVFAGEAAGFTLHIHNPNAIDRPHLQIKLTKPHSFTLPADGKTTQTLYELTQTRGWHNAGTITVFSTYPLGIFHAWSPLRFTMKTLVYPKPSTLELPFPETPSDDTELGMNHKGADDFYGLQEYQAGDSIRHIHWKAFAKGQGLYSKQYSGTGTAAEVWLDYNYAAGHNVEERLSCLCRWVIDAERADIRYGLVLPNLKLMPDRGSAHYHHCLEALALL
ncbi:MAG: DUF58 domain-containing protein [Methylococcales bacterium]|nr:DUF58 domain-containing protein [Methylococcales bacterium]